MSNKIPQKIQAKFMAKKAECPFMGEPNSDGIYEVSNGNYLCHYTKCGMISCHKTYGCYEVHGGILEEWYKLGGVNGPLGFPVSDEQSYDGYGCNDDRISHFENGAIVWRANTMSCEMFPKSRMNLNLEQQKVFDEILRKSEQFASEHGVEMGLRDRIKRFADAHHVEIGILEMAVGAALISYGVQTGVIKYGIDVVGSWINPPSKWDKWMIDVFGPFAIGSTVGGLGGAAAFVGMGVSLLSKIGIVAGPAGGIGVPVLVIVGGAAAIAGLFGVNIKLISDFMNQISTADIVKGVGALGLGVGLLIDGIQRVLPEVVKEKICGKVSEFKDGCINFVKASWEYLKGGFETFLNVVDMASGKIEKLLAKHKEKLFVGTGGLVIGGTVGTAWASSMVTVLGSKALGGLALSLGLVSAPVWPVLLVGGLGGAVGVSLMKLIRGRNDVDRMLEQYSMLKA